jgi:soluble lytic murein transglycosylase-like protein
MPSWSLADPVLTPARRRRTDCARAGCEKTVILCLAAVWLTAPPASAEIIRLAGGRTMSVKAHRDEGDQVVLMLRTGGEIVCARSMVAEILPDEVPYPEPDPEAEPSPAALNAGLEPYSDLIGAAAERHGVSPRLLRAMISVESNFQQRARSRRGAMGLMQLMPTTARLYSVTNPYDPRSNIEAGARHLRMLLDRFDVSRALAAYNAGEGAVRRFGGIPPYPETRDYVRRILRLVDAGH